MKDQKRNIEEHRRNLMAQKILKKALESHKVEYFVQSSISERWRESLFRDNDEAKTIQKENSNTAFRKPFHFDFTRQWKLGNSAGRRET